MPVLEHRVGQGVNFRDRLAFGAQSDQEARQRNCMRLSRHYLAHGPTHLTAPPSPLSGPTTFYASRAISPGNTLYFVSGTTPVVTNLLDLKDVSLRSTLNNATWYIRLTGSNQTIVDVNVKDSNANNGNTIVANPTSIDSGNNRNWDLSAPAAITNLAITVVSTSTVALTWPVPADLPSNPYNCSYAIQYTP